jgi:hypothetical protein
MQRVAMGVTRRVRRMTRSPFPPGAERPVLAHVSHHKVGTVWFSRILESMALHYGLRIGTVGARFPFEPGADIYQYLHSRNFNRARLEGTPFRGSHMIRDPRDVVVSAYHYHRWTDEAWVHRPREELGGRSYQEHLNAVDLHEGLLAEIHRSLEITIVDMGRWDYDQDEFLELRYEDVIADEAAAFESLFEHWGLSDEASAIARQAVEDASFRKQAGRKVGEAADRSHLRSGEPGEWRTTFAPEHVALFKEVAGDVLVRLGYEPDDRWGVDA